MIVIPLIELEIKIYTSRQNQEIHLYMEISRPPYCWKNTDLGGRYLASELKCSWPIKNLETLNILKNSKKNQRTYTKFRYTCQILGWNDICAGLLKKTKIGALNNIFGKPTSADFIIFARATQNVISAQYFSAMSTFIYVS